MLVVETIAKIRLAYFSRKMTIKAICRDLRVSRKVVRKVIRSQATEFHYQRDVQPQPKIGPWRERLDSLLLENDGKPARERLTLIRVFEELRGLGYEGGYDAVRRYARAWSKERASETANAYVPLSFAPGEAYQFDWSHEIVVMDGVLDLWARRAGLRLISRRISDAAMEAKDAGNDAEFHRLLDREDDTVTGMIAVENEIEKHMKTSLLALGAAILIEMRQGDSDIEADIYSASLAAIRPQLIGAIAEDADRVLAEDEEART